MKSLAQSFHLTVAVVAAHLLALFAYGLATWEEEESPRYPESAANPLVDSPESNQEKEKPLPKESVDDRKPGEASRAASAKRKNPPASDDDAKADSEKKTETPEERPATIAEASHPHEDTEARATIPESPLAEEDTREEKEVSHPAAPPVDQPALERQPQTEGKGDAPQLRADAEAIPRPAREVPLSMGGARPRGGGGS